jgi:hypothetical protein
MLAGKGEKRCKIIEIVIVQPLNDLPRLHRNQIPPIGKATCAASILVSIIRASIHASCLSLGAHSLHHVGAAGRDHWLLAWAGSFGTICFALRVRGAVGG